MICFGVNSCIFHLDACIFMMVYVSSISLSYLHRFLYREELAAVVCIVCETWLTWSCLSLPVINPMMYEGLRLISFYKFLLTCRTNVNAVLEHSGEYFSDTVKCRHRFLAQLALSDTRRP